MEMRPLAKEEGDLMGMESEMPHRRKKMLKLRETLLSVQEERIQGSSVGYSVEEAVSIMRAAVRTADGYGLSIEAYEQREEAIKLRAKLEAEEQARLSGAPTYTLEEARKRLEDIYQEG